MESINVRFTYTDEAIIPSYKTEGASGIDLFADIQEDLTIHPGEILKVPTGVAFEIPVGYEGQIRPRSGSSLIGRVAILGTIDSDYRGEVSIILSNICNAPYVVHPKDRIAQMVFAPVVKANLEPVLVLNETLRGTNGFGSTCIK